MFDKIKNIFKSDKEENNVTPKNAPKEVTVPAHKIGPKSQDDTTIYVISLYFGSIGIKNIRYSLKAGLFADLVTLIMSVLLVSLMFGS